MTISGEVELLVHIGIDTVSLNGEGFERLVEPGVKIKAGTPIIKVNREFVESKGFSLITPVLITNPDVIKEMNPVIGSTVKEGLDTIITYK